MSDDTAQEASGVPPVDEATPEAIYAWLDDINGDLKHLDAKLNALRRCLKVPPQSE